MKDQALYELLQMLPVEPGTFLITLPESAKKAERADGQAEVVLSRPFELGQFPVTNLVWHLVTGEELVNNPFLPKSSVSWFDAVEFCSKLNELLGLPQAIVARSKRKIDLNSPGFRLPTEAEWEYCCRAGTTEARYGHLDDIAWHEGNSCGSIQPIGLKLPNAWGFYDTLGNVLEWCWDLHDKKRLGGIDPTGSTTGSDRVLRGGAWNNDASGVRAAWRYYFDSGFRFFNSGFRLARTI
jgi:formylglycine-generating enzyme required for sulfatase activity